MSEISFNNSYSWGFDGGWLNKSNKDSIFHVKMPSPIGEVLSIRDEVKRICSLVKEKYHNETFIISFSGGYDSQVTVLMMMELNVKFDLVFRASYYKGILINENELLNAKTFCNKYQLKLNILPIDIDKRIPFYKYLANTYYHIPVWNTYVLLEIPISFPDRITLTSLDDGPLRPNYNDYVSISQANSIEDIHHQFHIASRRDYEFDPYTITPMVDLSRITLDLNIECVHNLFLYHPNLKYAFLRHPINLLFRQRKKQILLSYLDNGGFPNTTHGFYSLFIKPFIFEDQFGKEICHVPKSTGFDHFREDYQIQLEFIRDCNKKTNHGIVLINAKDIDELNTLDSEYRIFYSSDNNYTKFDHA